MIYAETKFDARTSPAGAVGLMQIEPATALFLAKRSGATTFNTSDLNQPAVNIAYGSYYLRYLLNEYHGKVVLALAAYNGGETNVNKWVSEARAHGRTADDLRDPVPGDARVRLTGAARRRRVPPALRASARLRAERGRGAPATAFAPAREAR